jgi:hypothetical protein
MTNSESLIPIGPYGAVNPRIVIDNQNNLYCVFPGYKPADTIRTKVFYTKNNGSSWCSPIAIDTFSGPTNDAIWSCDIAVNSPNNIWVTWDRGGDSDWRKFVSHFNGMSWSSQIRIDDGKTHNGAGTRIALDGNGFPFIAWVTDTVWYNRYVGVGITDEQKITEPMLFNVVSVGKNIKIECQSEQPDEIKISIYDICGKLIRRIEKFNSSGKYIYNINVPQGIYFINLETPTQTYRAKTIVIR